MNDAFVENIPAPEKKETQKWLDVLAVKIKKHLAVLTFVLVGSAVLFLGIPKNSPSEIIVQNSPSPTPKIDEPFRTYTAPTIADKPVYTIFLLGDSMTHALGPHGGTFNEFINDLYKNNHKEILIDNYGSANNNILSLKTVMTTKTTYWDSTFEPLLSREFDLILIESFGYNPLSQFPLEEGLKKQTESLDEAMKTLITSHPHAAIVFVATIAPSKTKYAIKIHPDSTAEERILEVEERIAYIKNHIAYAQTHNIPLINIFEKSLNDYGDGNLLYINPDDYIHPSFAGIDFIGHEIANFIYDNQILPR